MMKRLSVLILTIALILPVGCNVIACNEEQTNTYVTQILFGNSAFTKTSDANVKLLLDALYLCCEQSDNQGQVKIDSLKHSVSGLPSLSGINISSQLLMECSHSQWEIASVSAQKQKKARKKLLKSTVKKVFDFGLLEELFEGDTSKYNSFAAMLYYSHILADYIADDPSETETLVDGQMIPAYHGEPSIDINGGIPNFSQEERQVTEDPVTPTGRDELGRCKMVYGVIGPTSMDFVGPRPDDLKLPNPVAWEQKEYPGIVNGTQLYNRCHLIGRQFCGIDNLYNLITGTRYLNDAMKVYEDKIAGYIKATGNHVSYRVTPIYKGDNKLASGVQMEAYSIEDNGSGIRFNVYCYNVQPGVDINYTDGSSELSDTISFEDEKSLPFAKYNASEVEPDLILEMNRHFEIIFKDQKDAQSDKTYTSMMNDITAIASEARRIAGNSSASDYIKVKKYEYDYFETLKSYVPLLLQKESFFTGVF